MRVLRRFLFLCMVKHIDKGIIKIKCVLQVPHAGPPFNNAFTVVCYHTCKGLLHFFHLDILVPCWVEEIWIVDIVRTIIYTIQILMKLFIHQLVPFHYPYHYNIIPLRCRHSHKSTLRRRIVYPSTMSLS